MSLKSLFRVKQNKGTMQSDIFQEVKKKKIPNHVAIIMDGNGRWAKKNRLPRIAGHRQGVEALRTIIETTSELGIHYLSLYAFSTENWKRPMSEVKALMALLVEYLHRETDNLHKNSVKIHILGDIDGLPSEARRAAIHAMTLTQNNNGLQVNIAINYGSRIEIIKAVQKILHDIHQGERSIADINETSFSDYLDTRGIPDPDLMIRTSGECRLSNFLLYQSAYTELIFTDKEIFWPDFSRNLYLRTIAEFQNRQRRYGGIQAGEE